MSKPPKIDQPSKITYIPIYPQPSKDPFLLIEIQKQKHKFTKENTVKQSLKISKTRQNTPSHSETQITSINIKRKRKSMMRPPGFEPGSSAWQADVLVQVLRSGEI